MWRWSWIFSPIASLTTEAAGWCAVPTVPKTTQKRATAWGARAAEGAEARGRPGAGVAGADYGNVKISHVLVPGVAVVWSGKSEKAAACG